MARPLLYDFFRTLRSKSVIVAMLLPILISLVIFASIGNSGGGGGFQPNLSSLVYYDKNGYHFLTYSANQYGDPISGADVQFSLSDGQNSYNKTGTTNSSGYSLVTISAPINPNYLGNAAFTLPGPAAGRFNVQGGFSLSVSNGNSTRPLAQGEIAPVSFTQVFSAVVDSKNVSNRFLEVFFAGLDGAKPDYALYYKAYNISNILGKGPPLSFNQSQMQFLGTLKDYHQTFPVNLPQNETCTYQTTSSGNVEQVSFNCSIQLYFELFSKNGTLLQTSQLYEGEFVVEPAQPIQETNLATTFFGGIMGVFIPLIAIIGSYSSYGKDRVTGVLESVLSRPVTRQGLSASRFLSTYLALGLAISIATGVVDLILWHYGGSFLDTQFVLASLAAFFVELGAFVGIMFFLSHLVRSSGLLIGIGIGLFIVLDLFWSVIIYFITILLGATSGSAVAVQAAIASYFFNPAQFISLVYIYLTNQFTGFAFVQIIPSDYGITIATLVGAGILWIAIPLAIFMYLSTKRD